MLNPPAKTPRRRKRACSAGASRSWLQAIAAAQGPLPGRRVPRPAGEQGQAPLRQAGAAGPAGEKQRTRAAASSMARGSPSRRRQTLGHGGGVLGRQGERRAAPPGPARRTGAPPRPRPSSAAGRRAAGRAARAGRAGAPGTVLAGQPEGARLVASDRQAGAGRRAGRPPRRAAGEQVLEVVQHQQPGRPLEPGVQAAGGAAARPRPVSTTPRALAAACGTSAGSVTGPRGTSHTPPLKSGAAAPPGPGPGGSCPRPGGR